MPVPATVPEWDPFAPQALSDPPASWRWLREEAPLAWSRRQGGFWVVSRFDDCVTVARDAERFSNAGGPQFGVPRPPLEVDRPLHTVFRRILQPFFAKERIALLEPRVRGFVGELLAPVLAAGGGDLAGAFTYPLPVRVLCAWLGLPDSEWAYLKGVAEELYNAEEGRGDDPATVARCSEALYAYSRRLVRDRLAQPRDPALDLVSGLLAAAESGYAVREEDAVQVVRLLLVAGHNSTTGALGNAILQLAAHADVQRRLREEPELIPKAVEEFLRLEPSVQAMPRWARCDVVLHGRRARAGDKLMLLWASANRDPAHFPDPDVYRLEREPNDHLTFGRGIHRCIGLELARLELRVTVEELLSRTRWLELAGQPIRTTFVRRGVSWLPVKIDA